ncbi:hypothetical protein A8C56_14395 [Niabella ginsenosidivorans]|uniref:DUF4440 domain-containing protein n=2 Tax=Niabella ginsenosidivorans TaxID=1176587 RepID=A0A1A9I5N9_9BACT|nr:hypothetical protein A8C56_14395 [Niabella ginsenosidivorans]
MGDEAIINEKLEKMSAIFREPTPELFRELFTEDCDYITFNGRHLKGIEENLRAHQQLAGLRLFRGAELLWESRQIRC